MTILPFSVLGTVASHNTKIADEVIIKIKRRKCGRTTHFQAEKLRECGMKEQFITQIMFGF